LWRVKAELLSRRIFVLTQSNVIRLAGHSDALILPSQSVSIHIKLQIVQEIERKNSINTIDKSSVYEILTKESSKPSAKWLEMVKTNMAKRHISNYLEKNRKK
jgi:(p)ppGpp synthase/HD superfamily hydrolase